MIYCIGSRCAFVPVHKAHSSVTSTSLVALLLFLVSCVIGQVVVNRSEGRILGLPYCGCGGESILSCLAVSSVCQLR